MMDHSVDATRGKGSYREGYIGDRTICELLQEQAEKRPDGVALSFDGTRATYGELDERSNQVAGLLKGKGVGADHIVAIMTERSIEMVVGILGILKAGGAYLPIDVEYPQERIDYILSDSKADILLTQASLAGKASFSGDLLCLDEKSLHRLPAGPVDAGVEPHHLAYVIYTSGSTGKPKGVMVEHRSVVNFMEGITRRIAFSTGDAILALTSISFDISILELLLPLVTGVRIVLADRHQQKNPKLISDLIVNHHVGILQVTPSRMQLLINHTSSSFCLKALDRILVGGEPLSKALLDKIRALTDARIYNMYGPTETTVWSTLGELTKSNSVHIGTPILNTSIYIVDQNDSLQPVSSRGELCISGHGVARGYLNRPKLTSEKFVRNPFAQGERMYRTGDIARLLPDGTLEYLGRVDEQVKVRGYRVELGEIESCLMDHAKIRGAAAKVISGSDGENQLCAYFVADEKLSIPDLKEHLLQKLPPYMMPAYFCQVESFLLTPNGKIDKQALPLPAGQPDYVAPREAPDTDNAAKTRDIELAIFTILKNNANLTVPVEKISRNDGLADIGLDSITFIKVIVAIETQFVMQFADEDLDSNRFTTVDSLVSYVGDNAGRTEA